MHVKDGYEKDSEDQSHASSEHHHLLEKQQTSLPSKQFSSALYNCHTIDVNE
jgi:hypothetical protein